MEREVVFKFSPRVIHCGHIVDWLRLRDMYWERIRNPMTGGMIGFRILESDAAIFKLTWGEEVIQDGYF